MTLMTAGTKSSMFSNFKSSPIPEGSYYYGIRDTISELGDGRLQDGAMTAEEWAEIIVKTIEKGKNGKYWPGWMAWSAGVMLRLFPQSVIVSHD